MGTHKGPSLCGSSVWFIWLIWSIWFVLLLDPEKPNKPNNGLLTPANFFSILLGLLLYVAEQRYHHAYATHLDADRPARRTLSYRSHDHPTSIDCDRDRKNRMDALPGRTPAHSREPRVDGMDLDRHGLCHLWNGGIGLRSCHYHEHHGRKKRNRLPAPLQRIERDREFFTDPVRRAGVFAFVPGDRASSIPPSQSSVPFFIRKALIRSNPASDNHAFVSAAE
jgi:hypothetical protein